MRSLVFDANREGAIIRLNHTRVATVAAIVNACRFSIVDYETPKSVADHSSWGLGLGRYPKQDRPGRHITPLPPVKVEHLGYSEGELDTLIRQKNQSDSLYSKMVACSRNSLIKTLRHRHFPALNPA